MEEEKENNAYQKNKSRYEIEIHSASEKPLKDLILEILRKDLGLQS